MSKKFNLNDSIKNKKHFNNSEDATFDKLMIAVQKDDVDLVRINFEIEKNLRQKLKSKVSAEGRQIKEFDSVWVSTFCNNIKVTHVY